MHMYYEHAIQKYKEQHNLAAFRPKAVLFDMDGVLFDSMPNHARSWAKVCTEYGLEMTPEEAYMHEGRTGASTINLLAQRYWHRDATEKEISDIYAEKCRLFNACPEAGRMPGAMELLTQVKAAGLTIVVVTGSGQQSLLSRLESNYPGFFCPELIVSSKDVSRGKPDPEPYLMGLQKAGVRAEEALVVENAPLGVRRRGCRHFHRGGKYRAFARTCADRGGCQPAFPLDAGLCRCLAGFLCLLLMSF